MQRLLRPSAQAWPYSQALWATLAAARVHAAPADDLARRIAGLAAYSRGGGYAPTPGGSGGLYFDDNLWIALALERAGAPTGTVRRLFALVASGWDAAPGHPCAGGVFWARGVRNADRNAVTTANAALLAARLYARTGDPREVAWARRAFAWTERCLGRGDGLVADHIRLDGSVDRRAWSYNQGSMIAAALGLYRAVCDPRYLRDAERRADAALEAYADADAAREPPVFLAIFYRRLLALDRLDHDRARDRAAAAAFAERAWREARDPRTGLFDFGAGPTLLDQAAMVQLEAALARS